MPEAGCLCGKLRISYEGEPAGQAICHCLDCRKISGSAYSTNLLIPENNFKIIAGTPKTYAKTADTGKTMTSFFCGDCGSTLWRETPSMEGLKIFKAGTLDDVEGLGQAKPQIELFAPRRVDWVPQIHGASQLPGMPS